MYTVAVQRELIAQHFLIGGDFGPENLPHSHHYRVEVHLAGRGFAHRALRAFTLAVIPMAAKKTIMAEPP